MKRAIVAAVLSVIALAGFVRAIAQEQEKEVPVDARILAYDKGPATINVSKYPPDMQAKYKLFAKKCTNCGADVPQGAKFCPECGTGQG